MNRWLTPVALVGSAYIAMMAIVVVVTIIVPAVITLVAFVLILGGATRIILAATTGVVTALTAVGLFIALMLTDRETRRRLFEEISSEDHDSCDYSQSWTWIGSDAA